MRGENGESASEDASDSPSTSGSWEEGSAAGWLAKKLSIVVTTSPVPTNPATRLLEEVVNTIQLLPGLASCPMTIVCDGYDVKAKHNFRSGVITGAEYAASVGYFPQLPRYWPDYGPS